MAKVKLSSRYQIVIPKDVRIAANVRPGQVFEVITKGGLITLVPDRPLAEGRGLLRGIRTSGFREKRQVWP